MSNIILAIESSCDNSSLCIMDEEKNVLFYRNYNQDDMITNYGGYIPNLMLDRHIHNFIQIIFDWCNNFRSKIDYVVLCCGPGIILSLSIGYALGTAIAKFYNAKIIYVDHIESHAWSHGIDNNIVYEHPFLSLIASGGHCIIAHVHFMKKFYLYAKSIDDAPGEVFDKIAYKLKLIPPTGAGIELCASKGKKIPCLVNIKRSKKRSKIPYYNMSFSGLKTRFYNFISLNTQDKNEDIAYSLQYLIYKEIFYSLCYVINNCDCDFKYIACAGGVLANEYIKSCLIRDFSNYKFYFADKKYTTDNAVMIGNLGIMLIKNQIFKSFCCNSLEPYDTFLK